jgi:eukaryotic-like serine/threonine-protein kinase
MRKFGLIAAIVGMGILAAGLLLRLLASRPSLNWLWMPGAGLLAAGSALFIWARMGKSAPVVPMPNARTAVGTDTARLLDNYEQRFAELKGRKPNVTVLQDLYALGSQLEQRGRIPQATAVYRHLARFDNTYKDVAARLRRLMDADRTKPKAAATPASPLSQAAMGATTPNLRAAPKDRPASAAVASAVPEAERLGRYQLEREIGRGAMGVVYLGRDTAINRMVAIKAIPLAAEFSDAELVEARSRFFREAETAGRLNHPNIVTIYDVGEERGLAYIAMEYLKGCHLSDYAKSNNLLEPRKVLEIISRTAEALGFAHKQQVVHRDIKPANLMYDPSTDVLKITDFGIARLSGAGSTRAGIVLGKLGVV